MEQVTESGGEGAGRVGLQFFEGERTGYLVFEALSFLGFGFGLVLGFPELCHQLGLLLSKGGDVIGGL